MRPAAWDVLKRRDARFYVSRPDWRLAGLTRRGRRVPALFILARGLPAFDRAHGRGAELFERLLTMRNDLGLLAEEYDPRAQRQLGNFPQAFSHVALVNTARIPSGKGAEEFEVEGGGRRRR